MANEYEVMLSCAGAGGRCAVILFKVFEAEAPFALAQDIETYLSEQGWIYDSVEQGFICSDCAAEKGER